MAILVNLRLAGIEAHWWVLTSKLRVPKLEFPHMPLLGDMQAALQAADFKMKRAKHELYRLGNRLVCAGCQNLSM